MELFALGTLWFWILVAVEIVLLIIFVENENGWGSSISLLIFAGLLQWAGGVNIIGYVTSNPLKIAAFLVCYFIFGTGWAAVKWWLFVRDRIEEAKEWRNDWLKSRGIKDDVIPADLRQDFDIAMQRRFPRPLIRKYKADFLMWMTFWWISMIWSLIDDFVKRIFKEIYYKIANSLQNMTDRMWDAAGLFRDDD